jgi:hypothetical protein
VLGKRAVGNNVHRDESGQHENNNSDARPIDPLRRSVAVDERQRPVLAIAARGANTAKAATAPGEGGKHLQRMYSTDRHLVVVVSPMTLRPQRRLPPQRSRPESQPSPRTETRDARLHADDCTCNIVQKIEGKKRMPTTAAVPRIGEPVIRIVSGISSAWATIVRARRLLRVAHEFHAAYAERIPVRTIRPNHRR